MKNDADIAANTGAIVGAAMAREWKITTIDGTVDQTATDIELRLAKLDMEHITYSCLQAQYEGMYAFECIYNEDYHIIRLDPKPIEWFVWDEFIGWCLSTLEGPKELPYGKFIVGAYLPDEFNKRGISLLKPLVPLYLSKMLTEEKLGNLAAKYGESVMWYVSDESLTMEEKIEQNKSFLNLSDQDVMAIPGTGAATSGLNKDFGFINFADLSPEIHLTILKRYEQKVAKIITGSTLTQDDGSGSGTYALGKVHQKVSDNVLDGRLKIVRTVLQTVVEYDAFFQGYDPDSYMLELYSMQKEMEKEDLAYKKVTKIFMLGKMIR